MNIEMYATSQILKVVNLSARNASVNGEDVSELAVLDLPYKVVASSIRIPLDAAPC